MIPAGPLRVLFVPQTPNVLFRPSPFALNGRWDRVLRYATISISNRIAYASSSFYFFRLPFCRWKRTNNVLNGLFISGPELEPECSRSMLLFHIEHVRVASVIEEVIDGHAAESTAHDI